MASKPARSACCAVFTDRGQVARYASGTVVIAAPWPFVAKIPSFSRLVLVNTGFWLLNLYNSYTFEPMRLRRLLSSDPGGAPPLSIAAAAAGRDRAAPRYHEPGLVHRRGRPRINRKVPSPWV